jgi:hypothetical protein
MIPFFRKTRKKMADDNKPLKYMRYAVGEIVLVVVGILIAIQINTWNQQRLLKIEETEILKSVHAEFSENLQKFNLVFDRQITRDSIIKRLLEPKIGEERFETLDSLIYRVGWKLKFNPSTGIRSSIINSGKIEIISNDTLKNKISNFNNVVIDYEEEEKGANYYATNFLTPYLREHLYYRFPFKNRTKEQYLIDSIAYPKTIKSDRFRNELIYYWSYLLITLEKGESLRTEMKSIISLIEFELNKK